VSKLPNTGSEAFSLRSFHAFIQQINTNKLHGVETDWREAVRKSFVLDEEQSASLDQIYPARVQEIQAFYDQAIQTVKAGGSIAGRISTVSGEEHAHELHVFIKGASLSGGIATPAVGPVSIPIAHCDANCRNWGWGPK
jgi:hypothetical protein